MATSLLFKYRPNCALKPLIIYIILVLIHLLIDKRKSPLFIFHTISSLNFKAQLFSCLQNFLTWMPAVQSSSANVSHAELFFYAPPSPKQVFSVLQISVPIHPVNPNSRVLFLNHSLTSHIESFMKSLWFHSYTLQNPFFYSSHPSPQIIFHNTVAF